MEEKQLNFNQPLLSVRRYTPTVTSQKEDKRRSDNSHRVNVTPPMPPPYRSELKSGPVSNPGAVPFIWEQTPGRPKEGTKPRIQNHDRPPIAPRLPPGRSPKANNPQQHSNKISSLDASDNTKSAAVNVSTPDEKGKRFENIKETTTMEQGSSDSGDSDEAFVDALDTLSRTESFFLNCSMSGLSGLDDLDVKPFSTDEKTRELMMDRFLPAAKAMASETPFQHAPKKQPLLVREQQPQQRKKTVNPVVKPSLRYGPSFAKRYSHFQDNEEEEESDDDYDQHSNFPSVCGLLPKFCLKSSLCLLNPVPAVSVRTRRVPLMSPADKVKPRSSSSGSFSETENESKSDDISGPKSLHKIRTCRNGSDQLRNHNALTGSDCWDSPLSFHDEKEALGTPKEAKNSELHEKVFKTFEELLAEQLGSPRELGSEGPVIEKTLYVDTEEKLETPNLKSSSPSTQDSTESISRLKIIDSSLDDFKKSDKVDDEVQLLLDANKFGGFTVTSSPIDESSNIKWGLSIPTAFVENQNFNRNPVSHENKQVADKESVDSYYEKQLPRAKIPPENSSHRMQLEFPVPPPLPKSPSDSWLWRTLPSVSIKSASSSRSYILGATMNPQIQGSKAAPPPEMKWEAIVKSSKAQRQNLRHTEDLLTPIPET